MSKRLEQIILELDADKKSDYVDLQRTYAIGIQVTSSNESGFSADISLEVSNDSKSWIQMDGSTFSLSGNDSQIYDIVQCSVGYIRVSLDNVSGSADVLINYMLK